MRHQASILLSTACIGIVLSGCQSRESNQIGGGVIGAATGALIGAQFGGGVGQLVAVGVGTLAGAFAGSEIGKRLTPSDHSRADEHAFHSLETGKQSSWHNPESGNRGEMVVGPRVKYSKGQYYREYTQTIYIDGKPHKARGRAYRQPDGSWRLDK